MKTFFIFTVIMLSLGLTRSANAKDSKLEPVKYTCIIFEKHKEIPTAIELVGEKLSRRDFVKKLESEQNPLGEAWIPFSEKYVVKTRLGAPNKKDKVIVFYNTTTNQADLSALLSGKGSDPGTDDISNCPYEIEKSKWGDSGYCYTSAEKCKN